MIEIKYRSANGNEHNLIGDKMRATDGNLHRYEWKKKIRESDNGDILEGFTKGSATYSVILTFRGELKERKRSLDKLRDDFEYDIVTKRPGTIFFGEYYIKGFVVESETKVSDIKNNWTQDKIQIYCPKGSWCKEATKTFYKNNQTDIDQPFLDYSYDYAYDYCKPKGNEILENEHYVPAGWVMRFYGPCTNPSVRIGENVYGINNITLYEGEYVEADYQAGTVVHYTKYGQETNIYHKRSKITRFFTPIPPGKHFLSKDGNFDFSITMLYERSEPKWS